MSSKHYLEHNTKSLAQSFIDHALTSLLTTSLHPSILYSLPPPPLTSNTFTLTSTSKLKLEDSHLTAFSNSEALPRTARLAEHERDGVAA